MKAYWYIFGILDFYVCWIATSGMMVVNWQYLIDNYNFHAWLVHLSPIPVIILTALSGVLHFMKKKLGIKVYFVSLLFRLLGPYASLTFLLFLASYNPSLLYYTIAGLVIAFEVFRIVMSRRMLKTHEPAVTNNP